MLCFKQPFLDEKLLMIQQKFSCVLASSFPKDLAEFYVYAMEGRLEQGISGDHWYVFHPSGSFIQIYLPSSSQQRPKRGNCLAICLESEPSLNPSDKVSEWAARLNSKGAQVVKSLKTEEFGAEIWMEDPEGNAFLIFCPTSSRK